MLAGWLAINESCQKWLASRAGEYRSVTKNWCLMMTDDE